MKTKIVKQLIIILLMLTGISIALMPVVFNIIDERQTDSTIEIYQQEMVQKTAEVSEEIKAARRYNKALFKSRTSILDTGFDENQDYENLLNFDSQMMGYVDIPAIGVRVPVFHDNDEFLSRGAIHVKGTSLPVGGKNSHPVFTFAVHYNADSSMYCVDLLWNKRSVEGLDDYSDLKVIAGLQEVPVINDCISVAVDENGNVLEEEITVTDRDGVRIVAQGGKKTEKTLTFQTDSGWYQISGSWNDDYESVVELLDWFWEHPIDFSLFPIDEGDNYTNSSIKETPDAFAEYLPDFASFGFIEESTTVVLKNGKPVHYEGHYVAHVDEDKVENQKYYDVDGYTTMHWCILAEPSVYDLEGNIGDIAALTKEADEGTGD